MATKLRTTYRRRPYPIRTLGQATSTYTHYVFNTRFSYCNPHEFEAQDAQLSAGHTLRHLQVRKQMVGWLQQRNIRWLCCRITLTSADGSEPQYLWHLKRQIFSRLALINVLAVVTGQELGFGVLYMSSSISSKHGFSKA